MSVPNAPEQDSVDVDIEAMMSDAMAETADETPVDPPEADDALAEAPDAPVEAVDEAPNDEAAPAPVEAVAAPEAPLEPFTFNAFKQAYEVPGLKFDAKRNAIVAEDPRAMERLKQMLSHGREWEARGRQELVQLRKENQSLREQPVAEIEHAKAYMAELTALMELDDETYLQRALLLKQQFPLVQAKAERAYAERLMEQARKANEPAVPDVDQVREMVVTEATGFVQEFLQNEPWATPEAAQKLTGFLQHPANLNQYVVRATRDMPELGLRAGQYAIDWDAVRELATQFTDPYRDAHARTATVQQQAATTTKVAQQNAAALATAKKPAPKPAPTAPAKPAARAPESPASAKSKLMKDVWGTWQEMNRTR